MDATEKSVGIALSDRGQGTVEAVFVLPILFVLVLLLVQPGIVLYDRMVMQAAAAEGCRLLATSTDAYGTSADSCEAFIRHRLASIPSVACFHVHEGSCTWDIDLSGSESSSTTSVSITNEVRPLPLFDSAAVLLGLANANGNIEVKVSVSMPTQPDWVWSGEAGSSPKDWAGAWL